MTDLPTTIRTILARELCLDPGQITPESELEELGVDSLDLALIADEIDALLGIDVTPEELDAAVTVADVIRVVMEKGRMVA